jgi:hypothetical protein
MSNPDADGRRKPRSMRPVDPNTSLHAQGGAFQLKYLAQQAKALLDSIDDLIAATERAAPVRTRQPYVLAREVAGTPVHEEARWERAIWSEWHNAPSEFVPNVCRSVVSYQVMLRDANTDKRWGEVDLLGRSPEGWPVVVELKGASSNEPPLRGIVEGVAYAIALRKAWTPCFGKQWCDACQNPRGRPEWTAASTVFAAPTDYWERVTGQQGLAWQVPKAAWQSIARLLDAFSGRRLPVSLVRLDAVDPQTPRGISASLVNVESLI